MYSLPAASFSGDLRFRSSIVESGLPLIAGLIPGATTFASIVRSRKDVGRRLPLVAGLLPGATTFALPVRSRKGVGRRLSSLPLADFRRATFPFSIWISRSKAS